MTSAAAVQAWVDSMGYAARRVVDEAGVEGHTYAEVLIAEGHDDMYTLNFQEKELVDFGVKRPHARKLVTAAAAVSRTLGTVGAVQPVSARRLEAELDGVDGASVRKGVKAKL